MTADRRTPVIVAARRTPIGTAGHALREVPVDGLGAAVISALVEDLPEPARVDEVVLGNCMGPGGNIARVAALRAGLAPGVAARTLDLQCGSGLAAIVAAADSVRSGRCDVVVAGGAESASTAPTRITPDGRQYARAPFAPEGFPDPDMGAAADDLARHAGITRERADAYAVRSFARAWEAQAKGCFDVELVPVGGVARDERLRPGMTAERLARLRPIFDPAGTVTPGNATGVNDGAAAVVVVSEELRSRWGLPGLRVLDIAQRGVDPALPGLGPVPAVRALRGLAAEGASGPDWDLVDRVEINEAFAVQVLACCDALELPEERVCSDGGALALGHPWGASGAVLAVRLFTALVRQGRGVRGLAAIAVGGGQGVAMAVERAP
ncbi:acetyl-CoA C-acyltransferase [Nostocoides sp. F2B08]|nr:thiolase family protein [Tetrasphaera sp. F2B08]KAB7746597.1 acetyl-CoA C-acyltransferase [Tetrasphaera sp. F2B08]